MFLKTFFYNIWFSIVSCHVTSNSYFSHNKLDRENEKRKQKFESFYVSSNSIKSRKYKNSNDVLNDDLIIIGPKVLKDLRNIDR